MKTKADTTRSRRTERWSLQRTLSLFAGLLLLVLALPPFFHFPLVQFWLLPLTAVYLFLLYLLPRLWLYMLPLVTVGLDLTTWTGRLTYTELDLVFLVTLASGLLYYRFRPAVFAPTLPLLPLGIYLVINALGYSGWSYFLIPPETTFDNPYYGDQYTYKVFKGLIWGLALVPMWGFLLAHNKRKAVDALITGMSLAALLLGLIVLWERGTLQVILTWPAWWAVVQSLLDLTSSYRVTGAFAEMHTGGEVIDGIILMLLPCCLYGVVYGRKTTIRLLAAAGCLALAYVTLVGFTRSTYAAVACALLVYAILTLWSRFQRGRQPPLPLALATLTLGCAILAATLAYRYAGSFGLAGFGALVVLGYGANRVELPHYARFAVPIVAVMVLALVIRAHLNSRWVEPSFWGFVLLVCPLGAMFMLAERLFHFAVALRSLDRLFWLGGLIALPTLIAFGLGGTQINERLTRVAEDLETREDHWANVLSSSRNGLWTALFGNGVGTYPERYIGAHPDKVRIVGSYFVDQEDRRDVLRLGGGRDLVLGQRLPLAPHTSYIAEVRLNAEQAGKLGLDLCERNLIYASDFMPRCVQAALAYEATEGAFQSFSVEINSGRVGEAPLLGRWPTIFTLHFGRPDSVIEIDGITLSADGFNTVRNGSFNEGLDHWFHYDDFSHLPWHVKNLWLQIWFESGWLGLFLFAGLIGLLLYANFERHAHDSLMPVYTTAVVSAVLFGLLGSPLDSARVSWLFYFYLGAGLASLRVDNRRDHFKLEPSR